MGPCESRAIGGYVALFLRRRIESLKVGQNRWESIPVWTWMSRHLASQDLGVSARACYWSLLLESLIGILADGGNRDRLAGTFFGMGVNQ